MTGMEGGEDLERLPGQVIVDILSRLYDASDLSRCRLASRHLLQLSSHVHSIRFYCTYSRFLRSRAGDKITPFKGTVKSILSKLVQVQSVRFDMEESMQRLSYEEDEGELSDFWLTDIDFVMEWMPQVAGSLRELCITDFWQQSCWRCTNVLSVISRYCKALCSLELRNAWLSVEGLQKMSMLTSLTLEFIRLNDESLTMINECFPALEVLHLINVGGLKDPAICLPQLRVCRWTVSNSPVSLILDACKLFELKLECCSPKSLIIRAPLLACLHLSMERPGELFKAEDMPNLRSLAVNSFELSSLIELLSGKDFVEKLLLEQPILAFDEDGHWHGIQKKPSNMPSFEQLGRDFPLLNTLIIGPGAWYTFEHGLDRMGDSSYGSRWKFLKRLVVHVVLLSVENTCTLISKLIGLCPMLFEVELFMHPDSKPDAQTLLISKIQNEFPHLRWKWKVWRKSLHGF